LHASVSTHKWQPKPQTLNPTPKTLKLEHGSVSTHAGQPKPPNLPKPQPQNLNPKPGARECQHAQGAAEERPRIQT